MNKTPVWTLTLLALLSSVGCAEVGNFFVPPHTKSDSDAEYASTACLYLYKEGKKTESFAAVAATAAIGLLIDRTAAAIKDESKRYQASYSARKTVPAFLYKADSQTIGIKYDTIRFVRFLGKFNEPCDKLMGKENPPEPIHPNTVALDLHAKLRTDPPPVTVTLDQLTLTKTKAKVASARWFIPWSWWMLLDRSSEKIDLKATITISVIVNSQQKDIIAADLPLGKFDLNKDIKEQKIVDSSSGPFALPKIECTHKDSPCEDLITTITITVTESNELGDVIGDAAKKVADNKQSITNFFLDTLKIEPAKQGGQ